MFRDGHGQNNDHKRHVNDCVMKSRVGYLPIQRCCVCGTLYAVGRDFFLCVLRVGLGLSLWVVHDRLVAVVISFVTVLHIDRGILFCTKRVGWFIDVSCLALAAVYTAQRDRSIDRCTNGITYCICLCVLPLFLTPMNTSITRTTPIAAVSCTVARGQSTKSVAGELSAVGLFTVQSSGDTLQVLLVELL